MAERRYKKDEKKEFAITDVSSVLAGRVPPQNPEA